MLILLLSSIFVLGCSSHGKGDETVIRYENKEFFTDTIAENIILKYGVKNVNNCFNSIIFGKDKKSGKLISAFYLYFLSSAI